MAPGAVFLIVSVAPSIGWISSVNQSLAMTGLAPKILTAISAC